VVGATLVVRDASGAVVARTTTAADGTFFAEVRPGAYVVEPQPAEGLMGVADQQTARVVAGAVTNIQVGYDTGIR
jgi:hypothetical protein